jgi:hypothetical protein
MKDDFIKGTLIYNKELAEEGFDKNIFSYYVDAIVKQKKGVTVFNKCKAIESGDGEETIYFTEGNDGILVFTVSENPNIKIKKLLLN